MIEIIASELNKNICKKLENFYFLIGNETFLLQDSQNKIVQAAKNKNFIEIFKFNIEYNTNWQEILDLLSTINLFFKKKILLINMLNIKLNEIMFQRIFQVYKLLHNDIIVIIKINNLFINKIKKEIYKNFIKKITLVFCDIQEIKNLPQWIVYLSKKMTIQLEKKAKDLISIYYENNIVALYKLFILIKQRWPEEKIISLQQVNQLAIYSAKFTPIDWIESILEGDCNRSLRILKDIYMKDTNLVIMIRLLQKNLILLLNVKSVNITVQKNLFDKYKITQNHRILIQNANHIDENQIFHVVRILNKINKEFPILNSKILFINLEMVSIILCHSNFLKYSKFYIT